MSSNHARHNRQNPTDVEALLWRVLRNRRLTECKFRRQHPIGCYIVDFACIEHRLVIEADGGQHAGSEYDARRTRWLGAQGWRVLRFWNNELLQNPNGVIEVILREIALARTRDPHPRR